jgi:hypothetical protein
LRSGNRILQGVINPNEKKATVVVREGIKCQVRFSFVFFSHLQYDPAFCGQPEMNPMKIVSTSYNKAFGYNDPRQWLGRIRFYTGILERLSAAHEVTSIDQIDFVGSLFQRGVNYHFWPQKKRTALFPFKKHRWISRLKPDLVLINGLIYPLQVIQLRIWVGRNTRILVFHRAERPSAGWKRALQKLADRCIDGYLFVSREFGKEWGRSGIIKN